jgi:hypothetical protein
VSPFGPDDLERAAEANNAPKPRKQGKLPEKPSSRDPDVLRGFLTLAWRPGQDERVWAFERAGTDPADPCTVVIRNGREMRSIRFPHQHVLYRGLRVAVMSADPSSDMPHLTGGEVEDVWAALCQLGVVLSEADHREEAVAWVEQLLAYTMPLRGFSLVPDARRDALMAIRAVRQFTRSDAEILRKPGEDTHYLQRPMRFVDAHTAEHWLRVGETAAFVRWTLGVEPLTYATLNARLAELGVTSRRFQDSRPPHPKAFLYRLTTELTADLEGES